MKPEKNILILGGYGETGLGIARLLLRKSRHNIGLAGRELHKAARAAKELNWEYGGRRVTGVGVNVGFKKLLTSLMEGYDLVIDAIPVTAFGEQIARAALDAGIDYLDLATNKEKLLALKGLDVEIQAADLTFITRAGLVSGTPTLMTRYLAGYFDSIDSVKTDCQLKDRSSRYTIPTDQVPTCKSSTTAFGCKPVVKRPTFQSLLKQGASWMRKIMPDKEPVPENGQILAIRAKVEGTMNGRKESLKLSLKHGDPDRAAAISTLSCILGILDGTTRQPGVHMMGHVIDPEMYLEHLWDMGMTVSFEGLPENWHERSRPSHSISRELLPDIAGMVRQVA